MSVLRLLSAYDICEHENGWVMRFDPDPDKALADCYYVVRTQTCRTCGEVWQTRVLLPGCRLPAAEPA